MAKKSGPSKKAKKRPSPKSDSDPIPTVDVILRKNSVKRKEILIEKRGRPPFMD